MYGKKRIVLTKDGQIVKAGGKSWRPIGRWSRDGLAYHVKILRPDCEWQRTLTPQSAEMFICQSLNEIRERVWDMHA